MRREAGFSLQELMIVTGVLVSVMAAVGGLAHALHRADRVSAAYAEDLAGLRRAVTSVEHDLREARSVAELAYELDGDLLRRDGRVVARRIALFEVLAEGRVATARIGLRPRAEAATRAAVVTTCVRLRGAEGDR
jgi:type II secretory pathway component PulJ